MTDHKQAALDWAGDDPNTRAIVHALVYVGDQIGAMGHRSGRTGPRSDREAERELADTPTYERRAGDMLAFLEREGTR